MGWTLLAMVLGLAATLVGSCWYMGFLLQKMMVDRHRDIDDILASGQPPARWMKRTLRRAAHGQPQIEGDLPPRVRARCLRELRSLTRYVSRTNLVENEQARREVLAQFAECARQWQGGSEHGL